MSCHEETIHYGAWCSFATQPPPSDEQANANRITTPTSAALIAVVPADSVLTPPVELRLSRGGSILPVRHESAASNGMSSSIQATIYASSRERLADLAPPGTQLIAINLEIHGRMTPALASSDDSVAWWLASVGDERRTGAFEWSQLVASDSLAAEIEAADGVDSQGSQAKEDEWISTGWSRTAIGRSIGHGKCYGNRRSRGIRVCVQMLAGDIRVFLSLHWSSALAL